MGGSRGLSPHQHDRDAPDPWSRAYVCLRLVQLSNTLSFVMGLFRRATDIQAKGFSFIDSPGACCLVLFFCWMLHADAAENRAAEGRAHWAFQPLHRPQVSGLASHNRSRTPIDGFIEEQLLIKGLSFSPDADLSRLVRRVAFSVTGLPPSPLEITQFLSDKLPGAWERMVERYLASIHYGERWGKTWLDAAGYADSNGYFSADTDRPLAYRYRDYVIRSLNVNKPFDRFVREQLAGDELADWRVGDPATTETIELLEATHFLRNGQDGTGESDGNPDEVRSDRYYALESALQIVGSSLFGMTIQCAKCHDHKFEPFTQKDYYALQAYFYPAFNIDKWVKPNERVVFANRVGELEAWQAVETKLDTEETAVRARFSSWASTHRIRGDVQFQDSFDQSGALGERWTNTPPGDDSPGGSPPVEIDSENSPGAMARDGVLRIIEGGGSGDRCISTRTPFRWKPAQTNDWVQATFDLVAAHLDKNQTDAARIAYFIALRDFNDHGNQVGGNVLIDGNPEGPSNVQVDYPGSDSSNRGKIGTIGYKAGHNYGVRITRKGADEFSLSHVVDGVKDGESIQLKSTDLPEGGFGFEYCCGRSFIVDNVVIEASRRSDLSWAASERDSEREMSGRKAAYEAELKTLSSQRSPKPGKIAWVSDLSDEAPAVPLLVRGNHKTPGASVDPAPPAFLVSAGSKGLGSGLKTPGRAPLKTTGRRLAFAEWLTDPGSRQSALLARVTVNRIWQGYFGGGIVSTAENFGVSGGMPSHPKLIEWLASELVDSGWDLKHIHRLILASTVFRQSSQPRSEALAIDPSNHQLWRYPLRRLDAESIRDAMIAVGDRLGIKRTGAYVPTTRKGNGEIVVEESNPDATVRSIFLQQKRSQVATVLGVFDAPSMVFNCTRRSATTMPLQSLSLLNSEFSLSMAANLAHRVRAECGRDFGASVRRAYLLVTGRAIDPDEVSASLQFLRKEREMYPDAPDPDGRAWNDFCQMLLVSNEFLYLE